MKWYISLIEKGDDIYFMGGTPDGVMMPGVSC